MPSRLSVAILLLCAAACSDDDDKTPGPVGDSPTITGCSVLPANHVFNSRIDGLPIHPNSDAFLATIGLGTNVHLDLGTQTDTTKADYYGIPYNVVSGDSLTWQQASFEDDDLRDESDCADADHDIVSPCVSADALFPIPEAPLVEGGINAQSGDHHLLVVDSDACVLWELYHAYRVSGQWRFYSTAAFDLRSNALRPAGWTSADAAGFPILPLLLREDEASTGEIKHALRFTIESEKIRRSYTWPARHLTSNGTSSADQPPMGQLFRLKPNYTIPASANAQSRAIIVALQRYGMYIADGGSDLYITGTPDADWAEETFDVIQNIETSDFEAVDLESVQSRSGFDIDSGALP